MKRKPKGTVLNLKFGLIIGLLGGLTMMLVSECSAQKCVLLKNEVDKFTGATIVKTGYETLAKGTFGGIRTSLRRVDSTTILNMVFSESTIFSVDQGDEIILLFTDNSKLTLVNTSYVIAEPAHFGTLTVWAAYVDIILSKPDIEVLSSKPIQSVRLYVRDGYYDNDSKAKFQNAIINGLRCVQSAVRVTKN